MRYIINPDGSKTPYEGPNYTDHYKGFDVYPSLDNEGRWQLNARPTDAFKSERGSDVFPIAARDMLGLSLLLDTMLGEVTEAR